MADADQQKLCNLRISAPVLQLKYTNRAAFSSVSVAGNRMHVRHLIDFYLVAAVSTFACCSVSWQQLESKLSFVLQ